MSRQFSSGKILYLRPGPVPLNGTNHLNRLSLSKYTHLYNASGDDTIYGQRAFAISLAFLSFLTLTDNLINIVTSEARLNELHDLV